MTALWIIATAALTLTLAQLALVVWPLVRIVRKLRKIAKARE